MLRLHDDILSFGTTLHHATFAIKRAIVIKFVNKLKYIIVGLWLFALIWSTLPLIGWSGYAPEGGLSVCWIDWQNSCPPSNAYIWCIFVLFFLAPFVIMVIAYDSIYRNVKRMTRTARDLWGEDTPPTLQAILTESKTARMACIVILFLVCMYTTCHSITSRHHMSTGACCISLGGHLTSSLP